MTDLEGSEPKKSAADFAKTLRALKRSKAEAARKAAEPRPCCEGNVHIAYRGISDDRMYITRDRLFDEIKYFRPNGLRAFCASCRKRLIPLPAPAVTVEDRVKRF